MIEFLKALGFEISHHHGENFCAHYNEGEYEIFFRKLDDLISINFRHGPFEFIRDNNQNRIPQDLQIDLLSNPFIEKYYNKLYFKIIRYRVPAPQPLPA